MPEGLQQQQAPDPLAELSKKLETMIGGVLKVVGQQQLALANQARQIDSLLVKLDKPPEAADEEDEEADLNEPGGTKRLLEAMSKEVGRILDERLKTVDEKFGDLQKSFGSYKVGKEVEEFAAKNKDFFEWQSELSELAKMNPGLTIKQMYTLVRSENPAKAKEMDLKFTEKKSEPPKFFGLTPTSSPDRAMRPREPEVDAAGRPIKRKRVSALEAASKAFDEVIGELPDGALAIGTEVPSTMPQHQ